MFESIASFSDEDFFTNSDEESHQTIIESKSTHRTLKPNNIKGIEKSLKRPTSRLEEGITPHLHISIDSFKVKRKTKPTKSNVQKVGAHKNQKSTQNINPHIISSAASIRSSPSDLKALKPNSVHKLPNYKPATNMISQLLSAKNSSKKGGKKSVAVKSSFKSQRHSNQTSLNSQQLIGNSPYFNKGISVAHSTQLPQAKTNQTSRRPSMSGSLMSPSNSDTTPMNLSNRVVQVYHASKQQLPKAKIFQSRKASQSF